MRSLRHSHAGAAPAADATPREVAAGSLVAVGSGIRALHQMTNEARGAIEHADKVFYAVCDPFTEGWIKKTAAASQNLSEFYAEGKDRGVTYQEMVDAILDDVRAGLRVCAVFYGHPGVLVDPAHEAIRIARTEGHRAVMLPGISTEGCLYADLGVDPGRSCLSYEATDFVVGNHKLDPTCSVILWQVDCVGEVGYHEDRYGGRHVPLLTETLLRFYRLKDAAFLYSAPILAVARPRVHATTVGDLTEAIRTNPGYGTLHIPPAMAPTIDRAMAARLGIPPSELESDDS
jgi:hypothetical protein